MTLILVEYTALQFSDNPYSTDLQNPPTWATPQNGLVSLWQTLIPILPYLESEDVSELVINSPEKIYVLGKNYTWEHIELKSREGKKLEHTYFTSLCTLIANSTKQNWTAENPIMSAVLPTGERIQICGFSTVTSNTVSITIRKPSRTRMKLEEYADRGYFENTLWLSKHKIDDILRHDLVSKRQKELAKCLASHDFVGFFKKAVEYKQNTICSGATGSGKTTFMKSLIALIPQDERLISIENVDELDLNFTHNNVVALYYSAGGQGVSSVGQKELLVSSLRMKPDRIFTAELLEGDEAFYFLRNVGSGHPGSLTSMHANSASGARSQLVLFIKESQSGRSLQKTEILDFLNTVHVIAHIENIKGKREMVEIDFNPLRPFE